MTDLRFRLWAFLLSAACLAACGCSGQATEQPRVQGEDAIDSARALRIAATKLGELEHVKHWDSYQITCKRSNLEDAAWAFRVQKLPLTFHAEVSIWVAADGTARMGP